MDYGILKHVGCDHLQQKIAVETVNIVSKDPTVDACWGLKPNSEHITKTDGSNTRRAKHYHKSM